MKKPFLFLLSAFVAVAANAQKTARPDYTTDNSGLTAVGPSPAHGGTAPVSATARASTPPAPAPVIPSTRSKLTGTWAGPLAVPGKALAVRLMIVEAEGRLSAVLMLPGSRLDRSVFAVQQRRDTLLFSNTQAQVNFECRRSADGATLTGLWHQPGFREALVLRHTGEAAAPGASATPGASAATPASSGRTARRTRSVTEWSAGYRAGNRPVGPWDYYRPAAAGGRELACTYDHDTGLLTAGAPGTERYEAELSPGHWSFAALAQAPWFVGGREALNRYTSQLRYPAAALQARTEGKVTVSLLVDTLGRVTEHRVVRGLGSACDTESLRVARTIPDTWVPGRLGARAVPVRYCVSFIFKLP